MLPGQLSVRGVTKRFAVGKGNDSLLARAASLVSGRNATRPLLAVDGVSLEVSPGEVVGIVGRNGSGKSTLLRVAAGIYSADAGEVSHGGELLYINGFSHGARGKLTMRENIHLCGSVLGLTRKETEGLFGDIVEFSGLGDFLDAKVHQFSSGMVTRLNFSTFIHCAGSRRADILLIDEAIGAGGDEEFRGRAEAKMREFVSGGATVLLVSHGLGDVERQCTRAVLLDSGRLVEDGAPAEVVRSYRERCR